MITFDDVERVVIESRCRDSCTHSARVTLSDGRTRAIPPRLIHAILSGVAEERINPNLFWSGTVVKYHFQDKSFEEWLDQTPVEILNNLFSDNQMRVFS